MKASFERHPDTQAVIDLLRSVNGEITYVEMARLTKLNTPRVKSVLASAAKALRKENIIFGAIRGIGLRRLSDSDKVSKSETNKKRMSRSAKRALAELETIRSYELRAPREQTIASVNRTFFEIIRANARSMPVPSMAAERAPQPDTAAIIELKKSAG